MHPRAKSHRTTPLSQRKKLESVCPDISPAPARSEGRGKDREGERKGEREGERGERDWGREKGIDGKTADQGCIYWGCECRAVGCGMVGRVQGVAVRCGWVYRKREEHA